MEAFGPLTVPEADEWGLDSIIEIDIQTGPQPDTNFPTYEYLIEEQVKEYKQTQKKPSSPLNRIMKNVFGIIFVYVITFVICDVLLSIFRGEWKKLYWIILGPINYITGAPLITRIAHFINVVEGDNCWKKVNMKNKTCEKFIGWIPGIHCDDIVKEDLKGCLSWTSPDVEDCKEQTQKTYDNCQRHLDEMTEEHPETQYYPGFCSLPTEVWEASYIGQSGLPPPISVEEIWNLACHDPEYRRYQEQYTLCQDRALRANDMELMWQCTKEHDQNMNKYAAKKIDEIQ